MIEFITEKYDKNDFSQICIVNDIPDDFNVILTLDMPIVFIIDSGNDNKLKIIKEIEQIKSEKHDVSYIVGNINLYESDPYTTLNKHHKFSAEMSFTTIQMLDEKTSKSIKASSLALEKNKITFSKKVLCIYVDSKKIVDAYILKPSYLDSILSTEIIEKINFNRRKSEKDK